MIASELTRLLELPEPIYIHLAAAQAGAIPFTCRGFGIRVDEASHRVRVMILRSQRSRLEPLLAEQGRLAVLLTSGITNQSLQLKGIAVGSEPVTPDDQEMLERQGRMTARCFPHLAALHRVRASECVTVRMNVERIYLQTPGPQAGTLLMGRS
ncbi:hypothetical protein ACFFSY_02015 [Paenibacillus aurantiacus]|uniref:Pyridoxamine 5'-phosphate oxidase family protein n=1 Tax=Paenibacillus aurantiacus TaxID=1936118 RepID=A0ABV5KHL1_9BACL